MRAQVCDGVACNVAGDVVVTLWTRSVSERTWRFQMDLIERRIAAHPEGIVVINLVMGPHSMPEPYMSERMREDYRRIGGQVRRLVMAPLGDSLWTSVLRAVVRSMVLIIGFSKKLRLVDNMVDALASAREVASPATPSLTVLAQMTNELHLALGLLSPSDASLLPP